MPLLQSPDTSTGIPPAAYRLSHENVRIQSRAACSRTFAASKACRTNQHALDSGEYRGGLGNPSWRGLRRAEGNAPPVVNGWASLDKVGTRVATLDRHEAAPAKLAHKGKRPRENDDKDLCSVLAGCYRGFQSSAAFSHGTKAAPTSLVGRFLLRQYSTEQIRIWLCMPVQCFVRGICAVVHEARIIAQRHHTCPKSAGRRCCMQRLAFSRREKKRGRSPVQPSPVMPPARERMACSDKPFCCCSACASVRLGAAFEPLGDDRALVVGDLRHVAQRHQLLLDDLLVDELCMLAQFFRRIEQHALGR